MFTELIPHTMRSGAAFSIANNGEPIPEAARSVTIRAVLEERDLDNPAVDINVDIFTSRNGKRWNYDCGFGYEAAKARNLRRDLPSVRCRGKALDRWRGKLLRVEIRTKTPQIVGAEIEID